MERTLEQGSKAKCLYLDRLYDNTPNVRFTESGAQNTQVIPNE